MSKPGCSNAAAERVEREESPLEHRKPDISYIEMIARAILDSPLKKLCLQDIYETIERNYPYFRTAQPGWRNSVRHNLSLHECFSKGERCENGKGHYWCIHPANMDDFRRGDFRRRLVKARVRRMQSLSAYYHPYTPDLYAPLQYYLPAYTSFSSLPYAVPFPYTYYPTAVTDTLQSSGQQLANTGAHVNYPVVTDSYAVGNEDVGEKPGSKVVFSVKNILSTH